MLLAAANCVLPRDIIISIAKTLSLGGGHNLRSSVSSGAPTPIRSRACSGLLAFKCMTIKSTLQRFTIINSTDCASVENSYVECQFVCLKNEFMSINHA